MRASITLLLLLTGCPTLDEGAKDTGDDDTLGEDTGDRTDEGGADWYGGCQYTATSVAADQYVELLGGTPAELAASMDGARSTTFGWTGTGSTTTLDHTLTLDVATAQYWEGVWVEGSDTGMYGGGELAADEEDEDAPTADSGDGGDGDVPADSGDAGGAEDTARVDTGVVGDTGGGSSTDCDPYLTLEADWSFYTGDGGLAEDLRATVRASTLTDLTVSHELDYSELAGSWDASWELGDPAEWDEVTLQWDGGFHPEDTDGSEGSIYLHASRTIDREGDHDIGEAMVGDVGWWGEVETWE